MWKYLQRVRLGMLVVQEEGISLLLWRWARTAWNLFHSSHDIHLSNATVLYLQQSSLVSPDWPGAASWLLWGWVNVSHSVVSNSVTPWTLPTWFLCPWNSPGKNTRVSCYFLLQGIFPIQGLNPGLLHCRQILYHSLPWATRDDLPLSKSPAVPAKEGSILLEPSNPTRM